MTRGKRKLVLSGHKVGRETGFLLGRRPFCLPLIAFQAAVNCVVLARLGMQLYVFTGSNDCTLRQWNREVIARYLLYDPAPVTYRAHVLFIQTGASVAVYSGHDSPVVSIVLYDNLIWSACRDSIRVWDPQLGVSSFLFFFFSLAFFVLLHVLRSKPPLDCEAVAGIQ
jgi:WD40 repeat protein